MTDDRSKTYTDAVAAVRQVVNRIDPMGLIENGAPEDEYDAEVSDLVRLVMRPDTFGSEDVGAIWRRWFGDSFGSVDSAGSLEQLTAELHRLQEQYVAQT